MGDVKILKSIDITSYTIMGTVIGVLFSVLFSIILLIAMGILNAQSIGVVAYIIPTIIVGTIMCSIYNRFAEGYLYNWLTKRMNPITFELKDGKVISDVSKTLCLSKVGKDGLTLLGDNILRLDGNRH